MCASSISPAWSASLPPSRKETAMFTNILVPTDGSELAEKAFGAAIGFAKEAGARITGYYAMQPVASQVMGEGYIFRAKDRESGSKFMTRLARLAGEAGVRFDAVVSESSDPA